MKVIGLNICVRQWFAGIDPSESHICCRTYNTPPRRRWIRYALFYTLFILVFELCIALGTCHPDDTSPSGSKHVLLLGSYGYRMRPYQAFCPTFLSAMENSGFNRENLFFEFLDLRNIRDRESKRALLNMVRQKYSRLHIDLIITVHQGALDVLLEEGKDILPEVPVLALIPIGLGSTPMRLDAKQTVRRVLPVYVRLDMKGTLERALDLFPQTRHVLFVSGAWETEHQIMQETKAIFSSFGDNLEFEYTNNLSMEEMLKRAAHLPPHSIIIYFIVLRDKTGRNFFAEDVAKKVAKIANAPVFCVYKSLLVNGVIGGSVLSYDAEGGRIAGIASTMLAGEIDRAEQAASAADRPVVIFDWQQIRKWKGDVHNLPNETVFINRPVSLWEQYGWYIAAFIAFSLIQSGLIASLVLQRRRKEQAEAAVRRSEERFRSLVKLAPIPMGLVDRDGNINFINDQHTRIFGYTTEDIPTLTQWWRLVHPDEDYRRRMIDRWRAAMDKAIRESTLIETAEYRVTCKDGTVRVVEVSGIFLGGEVLVCFIDLTARKRAEEEILQLNQELEARVVDRTAKLKAANNELEAFAYSVSHDLRSPLRHIVGFLELLEKSAGMALGAESRHHMDNISDAAKKMGQLIEDLLSFSRMGRKAMSVRQVELEPIVRNVIREFEPDTAERNIHWHIGDLPVVGGDASMLRIVFGNLISNALKFTRPLKMAQIEIGALPGQDSETVIYVRDNGVGFDMAYAGNLFGVFQRLHRVDEFEGTGIGLANVRRIIARHGGRTWAESVPNQGATFFFSLPYKP